MANPDRAEFIELLGRLGAKDDRTALEAARALDRSVREAGLAWDDLLRPEGEPEAGPAPAFAAPPAAPAPEPEPAEAEPETEPEVETEAEAVDVAEVEEEDEADEAPEPAAKAEEDGPPASKAQRAEALKLIGRLRAHKTLSKATREEIAGFKRAIGEGRLDLMDYRYICALARRLGG